MLAANTTQPDITPHYYARRIVPKSNNPNALICGTPLRETFSEATWR